MARLEAMWAHFGAMLAHLGARLAHLGAMLAHLGAQFVEEKIVQTPATLHVKSHLALCNALWTSTKASCAVGCLLHFMQSKNR